MEWGEGVVLAPGPRGVPAGAWRWLMAMGVLAILVGCAAIAVPAVASVGTAVFAGWVLVVGGGLLLAGAFRAHSIATLAVRLGWALLTVLVGLWLIVQPHNGTLTLTLALGVYFLVIGATRLVVAFASRGRPSAGLLGLSGLVGLLIGALILVKLPSSADWAIGLLVGVDLIVAGWTLASAGLLGRDLSRAARRPRQAAATTIPE